MTEHDTAAPEVADAAAEPHPGYIRLQIDMNYDARSHGYFMKAPAEWASWTPDEQQEYLDDRAQQYLDEQIEAHGTYYATADEARDDNNGGWGLAFDEDDVEDSTE